MSWLSDAAAYLATTMTGTHAVNSDVFSVIWPECPDTSWCCYDAGGSMTPWGPDVPWQECRLEVRVRAPTDALAQTAMGLVTTALHGKVGLTLNTTTACRWIRLDMEPSYLKTDQKRRIVYLARFTLQVARTIYKTS